MNALKTTGEFKSSDGIHQIRYYVYAPAEPPRAILQISHGMCEYIERYEEFADALCRHGFLVCGNDHLGHGPMAKESGDLGYFGPKDGWKLLPEDLHLLTLRMKKQYPGLPYFLLGHSMGSFVARRYLSRYGDELNAAVIMGTSGGNPFAGVGILLAKAVIRMRGEKYVSRMLADISMGGYNKRFSEENDKNSWLSREVSIRNKYAGDELCSFTFTASGYRDLFSLLRSVSGRDWAETVPKDLPVLLTSGGMDPVGDFGQGVTRVYHRLKEAGVRDVELKLYPESRHEVLNETDREQVYEDVRAYLEKHMG